MSTVTYPDLVAAWANEELGPQQQAFLADRGIRDVDELMGEPPHRQVKHMSAAGLTVGEIAHITEGLSHSDVVELVHEHVPVWLPRAVGLHTLGKTVAQISDTIEVPRPTIYYHFKDLGIEPNRVRAHEITISKHRRVHQLLDMGWSYPDIAERVGITYDQVRAAVRRGA